MHFSKSQVSGVFVFFYPGKLSTCALVYMSPGFLRKIANWRKLMITFKHHFGTLKPVILPTLPFSTSFFPLSHWIPANYWLPEFRLVINIFWWQSVTRANTRQPVNGCFQIHPNMAVNLWLTVFLERLLTDMQCSRKVLLHDSVANYIDSGLMTTMDFPP